MAKIANNTSQSSGESELGTPVSFRFPNYIWKQMKTRLKNLEQEHPEHEGIYDHIKKFGLMHFHQKSRQLHWIDDDQQLRDKYKDVEILVEQIWQITVDAINEANNLTEKSNPYFFLKSPDRVKEVMAYHKELYEYFDREKNLQLLRGLRRELRNLLYKSLSPRHPFIKSIRELYGMPRRAHQFSKNALVDWHIRAFAINYILEERFFGNGRLRLNELMQELNKSFQDKRILDRIEKQFPLLLTRFLEKVLLSSKELGHFDYKHRFRIMESLVHDIRILIRGGIIENPVFIQLSRMKAPSNYTVRSIQEIFGLYDSLVILRREFFDPLKRDVDRISAGMEYLKKAQQILNLMRNISFSQELEPWNRVDNKHREPLDAVPQLIAEAARFSGVIRSFMVVSAKTSDSEPVTLTRYFKTWKKMYASSYKTSSQGTQIDVEIQGEPDVEITADKSKLLRMVINLASNAGKAISKKEIGNGYLLKGENKIIINIFKNEKDAVIQFSDRGTGIPREKINRIFDLYETTDDEKGVIHGHGMTFIKETVEELGGSIGVESEPGFGTTLTIRIPPEKPSISGEAQRMSRFVARLSRSGETVATKKKISRFKFSELKKIVDKARHAVFVISYDPEGRPDYFRVHAEPEDGPESYGHDHFDFYDTSVRGRILRAKRDEPHVFVIKLPSIAPDTWEDYCRYRELRPLPSIEKQAFYYRNDIIRTVRIAIAHGIDPEMKFELARFGIPGFTMGTLDVDGVFDGIYVLSEIASVSLVDEDTGEKIENPDDNLT